MKDISTIEHEKIKAVHTVVLILITVNEFLIKVSCEHE